MLQVMPYSGNKRRKLAGVLATLIGVVKVYPTAKQPSSVRLWPTGWSWSTASTSAKRFRAVLRDEVKLHRDS